MLITLIILAYIGFSAGKLIFAVSDAQLSQGIEKIINTNEQLRFEVANEVFFLDLVNYTNDSAEIKLSSIAELINLNINKEKRFDLNNDGKIDLVDFSIMAYYWTG